jgi:hypothetical protein
MAYEQKPGDIAVFKERDKRNDKAPDWKGTMVAHRDIRAGEKLEVAFWQKSDTMLAGKVSDPRQRTEQRQERPASSRYDELDEVPF